MRAGAVTTIFPYYGPNHSTGVIFHLVWHRGGLWGVSRYAPRDVAHLRSQPCVMKLLYG